MGLIKCDQCGDLVNEFASACPKCGAPVIDRNQQTLKAQSVYTVLAIVVAIISGIVTLLIWRHMLQPVLTLPQN